MLSGVTSRPDSVNTDFRGGPLARSLPSMTQPSIESGATGITHRARKRQRGTRGGVNLVPVVGFDDLDVVPIERPHESWQHGEDGIQRGTHVRRVKDRDPP